MAGKDRGQCRWESIKLLFAILSPCSTFNGCQKLFVDVFVIILVRWNPSKGGKVRENSNETYSYKKRSLGTEERLITKLPASRLKPFRCCL